MAKLKPDKHGVTRHAPDPKGYYQPDSTLTAKMRGGITKAVVIPRGTKYGAGEGFTAGPGLVSVDPSDPDTGGGGLAIDLGTVDAELSARAYELACAETEDETERILKAYQFLSMGQDLPDDSETDELEEEEEERVNPVMPGAYVVPKSTMSGKQIKPKAATKKVKQEKPKMKSVVTHSQKKMVKRSAEEATGNGLENLVKELLNRLPTQEPVRRAKPKAQQLPSRPTIMEEPPEQPKTKTLHTDGETYTKAQAVAAIKQGFELLGIPNLGPEPTKPKFRVQFDLGPAGKQEAWYHWVGEHDGCLFLIYDTRFEYGMRYSPPNMGMSTPINIRLPDHNRSYRVYSMDFCHPFGIFYITNLIVVDDAAQTPGGPPVIAEVSPYLLGDNNGEEWGNQIGDDTPRDWM